MIKSKQYRITNIIHLEEGRKCITLKDDLGNLMPLNAAILSMRFKLKRSPTVHIFCTNGLTRFYTFACEEEESTVILMDFNESELIGATLVIN